MSGISSLWPRRTDGLPPGQRLLERITGTDWARFEAVEQTSDFHCVTTWSVTNLRWGGHLFAGVIRTLLGTPLVDLPQYMTANAADGTRAIFRTKDLDRSDTLLATHLGGERLDRRHGAPLRLVSPHQYGYKNVKHLDALAFSSERPESTIGSREHLRASIDAEERHSSLPNWMVRSPYRLSIVPTALAAERGLRNSPGATGCASELSERRG